jgi:hypothetical protein
MTIPSTQWATEVGAVVAAYFHQLTARGVPYVEAAGMAASLASSILISAKFPAPPLEPWEEK